MVLLKNFNSSWLFAIIVLLHQIGSAESGLAADERRLINDLVRGNDILSRPVWNVSDTLTVKMGLALIKIMDFDEAASVMRSNVWLRFLWHDFAMIWNPADYGNIGMVRVPIETIWRPDILLYNGVGMEKHWDEGEHRTAVIYNDGTVRYIHHATLTTQCAFNHRLYPYDNQTCYMKFGSWNHDIFKLDLGFYEERKSIDLTDYQPDIGWKLLNVGAVKIIKKYPCCVEPYPDITFNLTVQRRSSYLTVVYIYPAVIVAFVSPLMFLIPHRVPGKILFGLVVLLIEVIQMMMLNTALPGHRVNTPIIVLVYLYSMAITTVSLFFTIGTTILCSNGFFGRPVPDFIRKCLLDNAIGRLCGVSEASTINSFQNQMHLVPKGDDDINGAENMVNAGVTPNSNDWKSIALILDRCFFVIMFVISVVLTLGMLKRYQY